MALQCFDFNLEWHRQGHTVYVTYPGTYYWAAVFDAHYRPTEALLRKNTDFWLHSIAVYPTRGIMEIIDDSFRR